MLPDALDSTMTKRKGNLEMKVRSLLPCYPRSNPPQDIDLLLAIIYGYEDKTLERELLLEGLLLYRDLGYNDLQIQQNIVDPTFEFYVDSLDLGPEATEQLRSDINSAVQEVFNTED